MNDVGKNSIFEKIMFCFEKGCFSEFIVALEEYLKGTNLERY